MSKNFEKGTEDINIEFEVENNHSKERDNEETVQDKLPVC